ncbi:hypothetical protein C8R46DRAFT_283463 [Mycena filopes]|nr:hypothetical protein C8R46DRAFT_283463 [Mycena filopes]
MPAILLPMQAAAPASSAESLAAAAIQAQLEYELGGDFVLSYLGAPAGSFASLHRLHLLPPQLSSSSGTHSPASSAPLLRRLRVRAAPPRTPVRARVQALLPGYTHNLLQPRVHAALRRPAFYGFCVNPASSSPVDICIVARTFFSFKPRVGVPSSSPTSVPRSTGARSSSIHPPYHRRRSATSSSSTSCSATASRPAARLPPLVRAALPPPPRQVHSAHRR